VKHIRYPDTHEPGEPSLFLGGTLDALNPWQPYVVDCLKDTNITIVDPQAPGKFLYEHYRFSVWVQSHLQEATGALFWFYGSLPAVKATYQLGMVSATRKPLFVGIHGNYPWRTEISNQLHLTRPGIRTAYFLDELMATVDLEFAAPPPWDLWYTRKETRA